MSIPRAPPRVDAVATVVVIVDVIVAVVVIVEVGSSKWRRWDEGRRKAAPRRRGAITMRQAASIMQSWQITLPD